MIDTAKVPKQEDLDRITALVKTAIGFDQKRGDEVQVVGMPFAPDDIAGPDTHKWYSLSQPEILHLAETLLFALIGVIVLLTVLRPMVLRITSLQSGGAPEILRATPRQISEDASAIPTPDVGVPLLEDDRMVNVAQIEGQLRASSMRRLVQLVERHPEETLAIVRDWMMQESA